MKLATLLPVLALAACTDNATKQESVQIFAAATVAMTSAQTEAVDQAKGSQLTDAEAVTLDYSGACSLGGTITVKGEYSGEGSDDHAAFALNTSFNGCQEVTGRLDGTLDWTSTVSSTGFTASMKGGLDWEGNDGSASCDFDLNLAITQSSVSYSGHLCGHDVGELVLGGN
ncbi:MAG TPA: hypothetical protein VIV11_18830 [Kofleriaceae bacterium]